MKKLRYELSREGSSNHTGVYLVEHLSVMPWWRQLDITNEDLYRIQERSSKARFLIIERYGVPGVAWALRA